MAYIQSEYHAYSNEPFYTNMTRDSVRLFSERMSNPIVLSDSLTESMRNCLTDWPIVELLHRAGHPQIIAERHKIWVFFVRWLNDFNVNVVFKIFQIWGRHLRTDINMRQE